MPDLEIVVTDNPAESRYEARVDGELAGFADYSVAGEVVTFPHVEVDDRFQHRGVAGELVKVALDTTVSAGHRIRPLCPYVRHFVAQHPTYPVEHT